MKQKIDSGKLWSVLVPAVVFFLCLIGFFILCRALSALSFPGALDMQPGFSYESASGQIGAYTGEMKRLYLGFQVTDVVFMIAYGFLFARVVSLAARELFGGKTRLAWLALFPVAAALCDFLEDAGVFTMIRIYPEPFPALAAFTSAVGLAKLSLFWMSAGMVVFGGASLIASLIRKKKSETEG